MTRNPGPARYAHQPSTVSTWHPRTPWDTSSGTPSPSTACSIVPNRVSSRRAGTELMRGHARRMSSRYVATTTSRSLEAPDLGGPHGQARRSRSLPFQDRLDPCQVLILPLGHRPTHHRQQEGQQALGAELGRDHDAGAVLGRRDPPLSLRVQAAGTSDGCPSSRPVERDGLDDRRVALDPLRAKPGARADRTWGELLHVPVLRVPLDLSGDVGQVVEDVTGRPRDLDGVLDGHTATLAHVASVAPRRLTDVAPVDGWIVRHRSAQVTAWVPQGDTVGRSQRLLRHPLLHHRALQQLLPHERIGSNDALRLLEGIRLESDQTAR